MQQSSLCSTSHASCVERAKETLFKTSSAMRRESRFCLRRGERRHSRSLLSCSPRQDKIQQQWRNHVVVSVSAYYGVISTSDDAELALNVASQLASTAFMTGVAAFAAYFLSLRQAAFEDRTHETTACPRCEGRRVEPCHCRRWSDNSNQTDIGCSSCNKSGYMACRSCRGGGTAVPIKARIYVPVDSPGQGMNRITLTSPQSAAVAASAAA